MSVRAIVPNFDGNFRVSRSKVGVYLRQQLSSLDVAYDRALTPGQGRWYGTQSPMKHAGPGMIDPGSIT